MLLTKKIPYYGKYNSISKINLSEDNNTYLVKRYDNKGKEKQETFEIVKKYKNTEALSKDYYNDVEEYLTKNKNKYELLKKKKIITNPKININIINKFNKLAKLGIVVSSLLIISSFYIPSASIMYLLGLGILLPSSTGLLFLSDLSKELKIKTFLEDYEEFKLNLIEYKTKTESKDKKSRTEYNGLNKDKNKGNDLKLKKIRTLENKAA